MTQQAREEGRTKGVGDLAGGPRGEGGGPGQGLRNCGDPWNAGDPGAIFFKGYFDAKIKFKGEARNYSHRKDIVKL